jgi:succinate dehydrogenase / fumarate reductase membrane anchor subunit
MGNVNSGNVPSVTVLRSKLGRARGLGSAKSGLHHWWVQRLTAIALVPLSIYFVITVLVLNGRAQAEVAGYISKPWNAVLLIATIVALFYHLSLGLQVVIEDYVHSEALRRGVLVVVQAVIVLLALFSLVSVLELVIRNGILAS